MLQTVPGHVNDGKETELNCMGGELTLKKCRLIW